MARRDSNMGALDEPDMLRREDSSLREQCQRQKIEAHQQPEGPKEPE